MYTYRKPLRFFFLLFFLSSSFFMEIEKSFCFFFVCIFTFYNFTVTCNDGIFANAIIINPFLYDILTLSKTNYIHYITDKWSCCSCFQGYLFHQPFGIRFKFVNFQTFIITNFEFFFHDFTHNFCQSKRLLREIYYSFFFWQYLLLN